MTLKKRTEAAAKAAKATLAKTVETPYRNPSMTALSRTAAENLAKALGKAAAKATEDAVALAAAKLLDQIFGSESVGVSTRSKVRTTGTKKVAGKAAKDAVTTPEERLLSAIFGEATSTSTRIAKPKGKKSVKRYAAGSAYKKAAAKRSHNFSGTSGTGPRGR